jgi:outer membrane protein assembly factor BamB
MRRFHLIPCACLLLLLGARLCLSAESPGWSGFRGPGGLGVAHSQDGVWGTEPDVLWKIALPGPGGSSPIVQGDHLYVTCYTGYAVPGAPQGALEGLTRHLLCLNRADGKKIWEVKVKAALPEEAKVRDHGYASSTPVADADRVYTFFGKSGVFAWDHRGKELWRKDVGSGTHGWGSATSPILYLNLVIVNASVESGSLIALDKTTGREVWRAEGLKESWNTPVLVPLEGGRQELVVAIMGAVIGFDPNTGEKLWWCDTGIKWYMVPSLVYQGDKVYCIGGRTGGALAVRAGGRGNVTDARRLWTLNKGSNVPSPILHKDHLYWMHENLGVAYCVEAGTGKVIYEERVEAAGQTYGSPVSAEGKIYAVNRRGGLLVLAASPRFQLLGRKDLRDGGSFDASPAADGSRLLIRSDRFLYCLGKN